MFLVTMSRRRSKKKIRRCPLIFYGYFVHFSLAGEV